MKTREETYFAQNSGGELTPRQARRIKHKDGRDQRRQEKRRFLRDITKGLKG